MLSPIVKHVGVYKKLLPQLNKIKANGSSGITGVIFYYLFRYLYITVSLISLYSNYEFQMVRFLQRNQIHPVGISLHLSWLLVQCFLSSGYFCEDGWSKIEIFDIMVLYTVNNST